MNRPASFDQLIADGLAASRDGRADAALDLFAQASALAPGSGIPHFLIASEQAAAGDLELAESGFANAVLLSPEFVLARYQLGLLQFSSQRAAVALLTWQPLLGLPDADSLPHFVRGFMALAQDEFDDAVAHYRRGLACESGNPALAGDIQQLVTEIERVAAPSRPPSRPAPEDAAHVLLADYSRHLH